MSVQQLQGILRYCEEAEAEGQAREGPKRRRSSAFRPENGIAAAGGGTAAWRDQGDRLRPSAFGYGSPRSGVPSGTGSRGRRDR
jgi:hypothetical protein